MIARVHDFLAHGLVGGEIMQTEPGMPTRLGDSDQMLADPAQDIRGYRILDRDGNRIGKVDDLLVDDEQQEVRMLRVDHGGLLGILPTPLFLPVETVEQVTDETVMIGRSQVQVVAAPEYDPELADRAERMAALYDYYGYVPYWEPGYIPPARSPFR